MKSMLFEKVEELERNYYDRLDFIKELLIQIEEMIIDGDIKFYHECALEDVLGSYGHDFVTDHLDDDQRDKYYGAVRRKRIKVLEKIDNLKDNYLKSGNENMIGNFVNDIKVIIAENY